LEGDEPSISLKEKRKKKKIKKQKVQVKINNLEVKIMTFIQTAQLGIYAPKSNESAKLAQEANKEINHAIFNYKQLFYGLRLVAWKYRDKQATFFDALSNGELDQFKVAPGHRANDGSYTKSEWNYDQLNAYMWNRFRERFDGAFNLEQIQELTKLKDIYQATDELLEFVLTNWSDKLLGNKRQEEEKVYSIGAGVTSCKLEINNISIIGKFQDNERIITLKSKDLPEVVVRQTKGETSWKGGVTIETSNTTMNSKQAETFSQMMNLAAKINVGIKEFMANPEGFLGIESKQAHKRNLQLIKEALLEINKDSYERRKTEPTETVATNQIDEAIASTTTSKPKKESLKQRREREAAEWLAQNSGELTDIDTELGLTTVDANKLKAAAEADLPM
jgi:hypothetical protein